MDEVAQDGTPSQGCKPLSPSPDSRASGCSTRRAQTLPTGLSRATPGYARHSSPPNDSPDVKDIDAPADVVVASASSEDTGINLGQLLRVEDACVTAYRSFSKNKQSKVDRAVLRLARCKSTVAPLARFLQGVIG